MVFFNFIVFFFCYFVQLLKFFFETKIFQRLKFSKQYLERLESQFTHLKET